MAEAKTKKAKQPSKAPAAKKAAAPKKLRASSPSTTSSKSVDTTKGNAKVKARQLHPDHIRLIQTVQDQGEEIASLRREIEKLKGTQKSLAGDQFRLIAKMFDSMANSLETKASAGIKISLLADSEAASTDNYMLSVFKGEQFRVTKLTADGLDMLIDFSHQSRDTGIPGLLVSDIASFIKANDLAPHEGIPDSVYRYRMNIYEQ